MQGARLNEGVNSLDLILPISLVCIQQEEDFKAVLL